MADASGIRHVHLLAWRDLADPEAGGSEVHMAEVARRWAEAGLDVTMRTSHAAGATRTEHRDGYRVIRRAGRYSVFPDAAAHEVLRRHGPVDAVVEAWNGVPFLTPLWFRGPRVVLLHHVHQNMWDLVLPPRLAGVGKAVEARLAPPIYRRSPIVTLSTSSQREITEILGLPSDHVTVAPPGIDDRFGPDPAVPLSPHPLVVAVGRLMPSKRFDHLIRIAAEVRRHVPDLELVIAGEGYERGPLERLIRSLDADGWIHLPGRISDEALVELYRRAWVVAATSMAEGWGMTLTEAAACGTPAVATRIAGHLDSVHEGHSGLLADDERGLTEDLRAVLTDADLRLRLSEGARKHAATFTWDATATGVFAPLAARAAGRRRRR